jgi:small redox-active disulfide protein 2
MKLQILGSGCSKCQKLAHLTEQAAAELGLNYQVEKVTDPAAIAAMGVMRTPALAVDGTVRVSGRVPSVDELKGLIG